MNWLPARLHRALLPLAAYLRDLWRSWRRAPLAGCAVIITNLSGDVLLLRHSYGAAIWALPGGGIRRGEAPEAAMRREVDEELGVTLGRVTALGVLKEVVHHCQHDAHLFAAVIDQRPVPDGREVIDARFFPVHSLPEPLGGITRARIDLWRRRGLPADDKGSG
jgi:8-oxo-dGTP pyrophosphatase MutT (NUDIX family)